MFSTIEKLIISVQVYVGTIIIYCKLVVISNRYISL